MNRHPIDEVTANRLLSGAVSPEDAPPGYSGVAGVIRTATGPGTPDELAGQDWLVAAAAATVLSAPTIRPRSRRNSMLSKLMSAKAAAVAAAATLGVAGVAVAATGHLPSNSQSVVAAANIPRPNPAGSTTAAGTTHASTDRDAKDNDGKDKGDKPGDKDNGAKDDHDFGQCKAFLAGSANGRDHKDHSSDFKDLIADHGGTVASTTAYCKKVVAAHHDDDKNGSNAQGDETDKDAGKPSTPANSGSHNDEGSSSAGEHGPVTPHHP